MRARQVFLLAPLLWMAGSSIAQAHFLFVRILPPAEGGRFAEVYFSDKADVGDPQFVDKIAHTQLWRQSQPGKFEPLPVRKTSDRLRAVLPAGSLAIVGECTYGVLSRAKQPSFLLRHYPKAVAGTSTDLASFEAKPEIPFEIVMKPQGEKLAFQALRQGKPVANAQFVVVASDLSGDKFQADEQGRAFWKPSAAGTFAVYTQQTLKQPGTHKEQKYEEIREFTTLAFAWPFADAGPDPAAVKLFQDAIAARASWANFPGFQAKIQAHVEGHTWQGGAKITADGTVSLENEDAVAAVWVREQLESMVLHRLARPDAKPPVLRFADTTADHPLGRLLVFEGGKFAASYRVKDQQILTVNRQLGKSNMTITVLANDRNADKRFLPRAYTVQYWDAGKGTLLRTETIQNRWVRQEWWDLPTENTVLTSSSTGVSVKTMTLSEHRLLK